jgi:hypothetical protein
MLIFCFFIKIDFYDTKFDDNPFPLANLNAMNSSAVDKNNPVTTIR